MMFLAGKLSLLSQWRYWSVSVGFLCTDIVRIYVGSEVTRVSRKGMEPLSLRFSVVNWMWGSIELICWGNWWLCSNCWMMKVSSSYLLKNLGVGCICVGGPEIKVLHEQVGHNWYNSIRHNN